MQNSSYATAIFTLLAVLSVLTNSLYSVSHGIWTRNLTTVILYPSSEADMPEHI